MADEVFLKIPDFHVTFRDLLHAVTWDKRFYFPSERRRAENFFALKNPLASAGFELANLGTKGQHATSRPPKPLTLQVRSVYLDSNKSLQTNTSFTFETYIYEKSVILNIH